LGFSDGDNGHVKGKVKGQHGVFVGELGAEVDGDNLVDCTGEMLGAANVCVCGCV